MITKPEDWAGKTELLEADRWEAMFRASVLTTTTTKFFNYIALADQKAQGMLILNSIIIPVALSWINKDPFQMSALISIITAIVSIFTAILCIYPKRRKGRRLDGTANLLHFNDIGRMSEPDFLNEINPIINDNNALCLATVRDLHDISTHVMRPKFYWLKLSYISFFIGNLLSLLWVLINAI